jgi:hypothetical protein
VQRARSDIRETADHLPDGSILKDGLFKLAKEFNAMAVKHGGDDLPEDWQ